MVSFMGIMKKLIAEESAKFKARVVTVRTSTELREDDRHRETIVKWAFSYTRDFVSIFKTEAQ